jgi:lipopolysaccharide biosynthesis glycosyltransferase
LIYRDLSELFNTDISNYAFGAVYDMAPIGDANNALGAFIRNFSQQYLNNGPYYNNGVLLLNLKKMAEEEHRLFEIKIPLRYPAQDLLNVAFVGQIKTLPLKYNVALGAPISSQFTPEEAEEINSGGQVIVDCYYVWPYDKEHANKIVYDTFSHHANSIGMTPEMFVDADTKRAEVKKTFIPHITVRQGKILFFGMEIEK